MPKNEKLLARVLKELETKSFEDIYRDADWDDKWILLNTMQRLTKMWRKHLRLTGQRNNRKLWCKLDRYKNRRWSVRGTGLSAAEQRDRDEIVARWKSIGLV